MCREPIDLITMEVDHVLPESLLNDVPALQRVLRDYGLPANFDLQSFENWMPACRPCNGRKKARIFEATPKIQLELQIAREKAPQAAELAKKRIDAKSISRAWNTIKRADVSGELPSEIHDAIAEFVLFHTPVRAPDAVGAPIQLTPLVQVLSEKDGIRVVRGPYGVGSGPTGPFVDSRVSCPTCGHVAWNGARCVVCGEMSDDYSVKQYRTASVF